MEEFEKPAPLRVCVVQLDIIWEDPARNWSHIKHLLDGHEGKYDLVILPEMLTTGFTMEARKNAEEAEECESLGWMQFLAGKLGVVIMGSIIVLEDGKYYNRLLVVGQDGLVLKYDKRHLFRMSGEHEVYTAGSEIQVFSLKGWRICPMICYDLRFPVWSRNGINPKGGMWYDLLIYVANWPERRIQHWKALLQARAIENQAWVIGANRVGTDGNDVVYSGDSMICDALGNVVAHLERVETLLTTTLDWDALAEYREKFPAWLDGDKFDIFG